MMPFKKNICRRMAGVLLVVIIFYFLLDSLFSNYQKLSALQYTVEYPRMIFSFLLLFAVYLFNPWAWIKILNEMQENLNYRQAFSIFYVSQLGKYVPGRVWGYISQVILARKVGVSGEKAFISSILFQVVSSVVTVYFFMMTLLVWEQLDIVLRVFVLALASIGGYILLWMDALNWASNLVIKKMFKRTARVHLSSRIILDVTGILILSWIAYGVAYYHFMKSFYPELDIVTGITFTGIYAISWLVGYVSLLTPGGLGIREGVQVYLLNFFIPLPIAIVISLASRVWLTLSELLVGLLAFCQLKKGVPLSSLIRRDQTSTDPASSS